MISFAILKAPLQLNFLYSSLLIHSLSPQFRFNFLPSFACSSYIHYALSYVMSSIVPQFPSVIIYEDKYANT